MFSIGVIGGGQLARMMQPAAIALGLELKVFAESEDSAAKSAATMIGDYTDFEQLEKFSKTVDVITFDHEHVPVSVLSKLEAVGVSVQPPSTALIHAQNKLVMRRRIAQLGLPQPSWREITSTAELDEFILEMGSAVIVKTPIGGYDGKGVRVVESASEVSDWLAALPSFGGSLLAEQKVNFVRELAQLSATSPSGEFRAWPLVQTVQAAGVCSEVIAPAPQPADLAAAEQIARAIAEGLGVTGVLAVELFEEASGKLLINELAMRPHNSGHFSIDASQTSQFEQHLRAVLDLPLGDTAMLSSIAVMVNLLGVDQSNDFVSHYPLVLKQFPQAKFHSYQKTPRPGRKMGHITVLGNDLAELITTGQSARDMIYRGA